jgi:hypothetical protein
MRNNSVHCQKEPTSFFDSGNLCHTRMGMKSLCVPSGTSRPAAWCETAELHLANIRNWKKLRAALLSNMPGVDSS